MSRGCGDADGARPAWPLGRGRSIRFGTRADDDRNLPPQVCLHFTPGANHRMRHVVSGREIGERNAERDVPDHALVGGTRVADAPAHGPSRVLSVVFGRRPD